jgi:hypothetical protein
MIQKKGEMKEQTSVFNNYKKWCKINKNDYILLMGDLNARIGNQKLGKI